VAYDLNKLAVPEPDPAFDGRLLDDSNGPPAGSGQGVSDLATENLRLPSTRDRADKRHL
jgi:hypothetical protein